LIGWSNIHLSKKILKSTCQKKAISGIVDKRLKTAPKN
jgi:hypothetical protein